MKGLLLKDWYMMRKYCRMYLLFTVVFLAVSCVNDNNLFFAFYPCLLCGMIPVNLQSYDERSGWTKTSGTLPYTKRSLVSVKYLTGFLALLALLTATGILQAVRMVCQNAFSAERLLFTLLAAFLLTTLSSAICLPFIFKFGTEKGRIVYLVMVGFFCGGVAVLSNLFAIVPLITPDTNLLLFGLFPVGCGLYALSWAVSVVCYQKREL